MTDATLPGQLGLFNEEKLRKPDEELLRNLKEQMQGCTRCGLRSTCKQTVFGEGNWNRPDIAFVGEGPGANEDFTGRPFVGRAGELLDGMIKAMGYQRSDLYIVNCVACRPPENRKPTRDEIALCREWFTGQLRAVQPKILVALGATAANVLAETKKDAALGPMRGSWHEWQGIPYRVTFHPAYLLRNANEKSEAWLDLQEVLKRLKTP